MDRLPGEITTNILSRLPVKPSARCRCVCKLWCQILSDPKIQLNQLSTISPEVLLYDSFSYQIHYLDDKEEDKEALSTIKSLKIFIKPFISDTYYENPTILGSSKGLICISKTSYSVLPINPVYVFNPITDQCLQLPHYTEPRGFPLCIDQKPGTKCLSGFGFEDSKQEYKLVLAMLFAHKKDTSQVMNSEVHVLTLGSTTWTRKVGIVPGVLCQATRFGSSAFVNGSLHWMTAVSSKDGTPIVSFNLGTEEFSFVSTPESHKLSYSLGVIEENLSVVYYNYTQDCHHIWVMKKYNVKESWVKQFSIKSESLCPHGGRCYLAEIIKFRKNGDLLLICHPHDIVSYNVTSQKCRFFKIEEVQERAKPTLRGFPFVGSLISLKSALRMDSDTKET